MEARELATLAIIEEESGKLDLDDAMVIEKVFEEKRAGLAASCVRLCIHAGLDVHALPSDVLARLKNMTIGGLLNALRSEIGQLGRVK